ncbi:major facilitator superfamily domain-containing protein [Lipomyces oligophaga]|uniref:major facilitator superfamily domain-containing protein n=1 Tax=Lipomyces oligophaga TaxID=45792 RepID=UPI0034CD4C20
MDRLERTTTSATATATVGEQSEIGVARTVTLDLAPAASEIAKYDLSSNQRDRHVFRVSTTRSDVPYSVFSSTTRKLLCAAATFAALFSPLATNIYFPSITDIADDLHVSVEKINLTVTTYMILQGISPTIWGTFADVLGRRPIYLLTLIVFMAANLGLALQYSYPALLVLRMVQSGGSSATVALGAGTIGDIVPPAERGSYTGFFSAGVMVAPAIAPVIGGVLSKSKDSWRASFWFLFAAGSTLFAFLLILMPETGRQIVGNGSVPAPRINQSVLQLMRSKKRVHESDENLVVLPKRSLGNPMRSISIIMQKDVASLLFSFALVYVAYYCVTVGFSAQVGKIYGLNTLEVGLCFLPYGAGASFGSIIMGKVLDAEFGRFARKHGFGDGKQVRQNPDFPLEHARLRSAWIVVIGEAVICLVFGWTFRSSISLACPLILLFGYGFGFNAFATIVQVLLVDLYPNESATVTAANNLVRCLLGAAGSAVVEIVINAIGFGWTFTIVTGMQILALPLMWLEWHFGMGWRRERLTKLKRSKYEDEEKAASPQQQDVEDLVDGGNEQKQVK